MLQLQDIEGKEEQNNTFVAGLHLHRELRVVPHCWIHNSEFFPSWMLSTAVHDPPKTVHAQGQARAQGISQRATNFFTQASNPPSTLHSFFLKRSLFKVLMQFHAIYSLISQYVRREPHKGNSTKTICFPVPSSSGITAGKSLHGELLSLCFSPGHSNFRQMQRNSCSFTILTLAVFSQTNISFFN